MSNPIKNVFNPDKIKQDIIDIKSLLISIISRDGKTIESRYTYINSTNTSELWVGKFTAIL